MVPMAELPMAERRQFQSHLDRPTNATDQARFAERVQGANLKCFREVPMAVLSRVGALGLGR